MAPRNNRPAHDARDSLELASLASSSEARDDGAVSEASPRASMASSRRLSLANEDPLDEGNAAGQSGGRTRSYSISSALDFTPHLFPLSSTVGTDGYTPVGAMNPALSGGLSGRCLEKRKKLTYLNGLSLIVGLIIGSGIFSSPSQVSSKVGSAGAALIVWIVAGILAWTGGASYAELGGAIPLNGGSQAYLAQIYGELAGFLFAWVAILVLKPGSAAIIAIIMGEYFVRALVGAEAEHVNPWFIKLVAVVGVVAVTFLNCLSTRVGIRVNDLLMLLKFVALLGVTIVGIVVAVTGYTFNGNKDVSLTGQDWFKNTSPDVSNWAVALYAGLWAFDGWDNTNFVVGEFRDARKDLPRVIHTAMPLVILSYVLANVAYFLVLPVEVVNKSNTVAVMFGSKVFGSVGALIMALTVSASCFGALNSSAFTAGRLVYVAGKEGYLPASFGNIGIPRPNHSQSTPGRPGWLSERMGHYLGDEDVGLFFTPIIALVFNGTLTVVYCLVGEFPTLLTFYGVAGYTFYFVTVLGLIVLRVKEPGLERPYKTWISTPIIFCCVSLFLLSKSIFAQPLQTLAVVGFVAVGIPVYYWRVRGSGVVKRGTDREGQRRWWRFWK